MYATGNFNKERGKERLRIANIDCSSLGGLCVVSLQDAERETMQKERKKSEQEERNYKVKQFWHYYLSQLTRHFSGVGFLLFVSVVLWLFGILHQLFLSFLLCRRDSFITHRAFCDALAEESARAITNPLLSTKLPAGSSSTSHISLQIPHQFSTQDLHPFSLKKKHHQQQSFETTGATLRPEKPPWLAYPTGGVVLGPGPGPPDQPNVDLTSPTSSSPRPGLGHQEFTQTHQEHLSPNPNPTTGNLGTSLLPPYPTSAASPHMSATALLQKAAQMGATIGSKTTTLSAPSLLRPQQQEQQAHLSADSTTSNLHWFSAFAHNTSNFIIR